MRKLYALLAGLSFFLASPTVEAQAPEHDSCRAAFSSSPSSNSQLGRLFTALPWHSEQRRPERICWNFGDGSDTCINYDPNHPPANGYTVFHQYAHSGTYNVCVRIRYQGGCEADACHPVAVATDSCSADFERLPTTSNPLTATFRAIPWHSQNRRPVRICWDFGDGSNVCVQYASTYQGPYTVSHTYPRAGEFRVCVTIIYQEGCEARKCRFTRVGHVDSCRADFERINLNSNNNPLRATFRALPWHSNQRKPQRICWTFGDGTDTCINYSSAYIGPYTVNHTYAQPGNYEVCVRINYYGGCEARKCREVRIVGHDSCRADFERLHNPSNNPLRAYFRALPWHNLNRKPQRICWRFGDGTDTCINYPSTYTGPYIVAHNYQHPGAYEVCVSILYYGGCEARKCREIRVPPHETCQADFERIPMSSNLLTAAFRALPWHSAQRKPRQICWNFGDGRDTCINYPENYTGPYTVLHHYNHPGNYEVCVRITYYGGCEARKCRHVGIHQSVLHLSPNPVANHLNVYFFSTRTEPVNIRIVKHNGIVVRSLTRSVNAGPNNWSHELGNLFPGIYTYTVQSPNQFASALFVKQ
ncbi:MAG TPA: PKD domain-containing protein [Chitinophagaceae bacterium]|nr:PKD domain-containing protein [Chitinophagaceae bacterium]